MRRPAPLETLRRDGSHLLAHLLDAGFLGPENVDLGVAHHSPGLHIEMQYHGGREPCVWTTVRCTSTDGECWAHLGDLYVACGCGPAQDVPESAPTRRTVGMRVQQQATGLRRVLPALLGPDGAELVRRCRSPAAP